MKLEEAVKIMRDDGMFIGRDGMPTAYGIQDGELKASGKGGLYSVRGMALMYADIIADDWVVVSEARLVRGKREGTLSWAVEWVENEWKRPSLKLVRLTIQRKAWRGMREVTVGSGGKLYIMKIGNEAEAKDYEPTKEDAEATDWKTVSYY